MINNAQEQREGREFLGRVSGTKVSRWGDAACWKRQHLWFGPRGHVGLLCCCRKAVSAHLMRAAADASLIAGLERLVQLEKL